MDRRELIKMMLLGTIGMPFLKQARNRETGLLQNSASFISEWELWPDMKWTGPEFWGNRLQDWRIRDGMCQCRAAGNNRTLYSLTHQLQDESASFDMGVTVHLDHITRRQTDYVGFRIGSKGKFKDYRSAVIYGSGLDAGCTTDGTLFIGDQKSSNQINVDTPIRLILEARPKNSDYLLRLKAVDPRTASTLDSLKALDIEARQVSGAVALISHYPEQDDASSPSPVRFDRWAASGQKFFSNPQHSFGPICFAQYTRHKKQLKLTAQLAPIEAITGHEVKLQIQPGKHWKTLQSTTIHKLARTAHFRVDNWSYKKDIPYRVKLELPLKNEKRSYTYEGTIAADPIEADSLKMAVFSCNCHYGFPNNEVVRNVSKHEPDLAVFLGDQFYESHGGFGVQRSPIEMASLDFLRKWYMFGWSYRDLFRDIPAAFLPDDHDVYHGNIWGEGGKDAPENPPPGTSAQDQGGYTMSPEWVNMVQRAQTSHLPDPFDPRPVRQDINVYYTDWQYGGISFAILEDRKFKSAPANVLPEKADIVNGFIQNPDFDIKEHYDIDAQLLGERQIEFLRHWIRDWSNQTRMKVALSQTNLCALATLPAGSKTDSVVPNLEIPEPGEYVAGDEPVVDMDTNGWPPKQRDRILEMLRKSFTFHIAGDQHLASVVQYGVDDFGDSNFAFTAPALNNIWPRRWWPPVDDEHTPLPGQPKYTGNFEDGFGNKMTVYAAANPAETRREPEIIYNRATGYGLIEFNKQHRSIRIECWPRYVNPLTNPEGQYNGWPILIEQAENYGREPIGYLPEIIVKGLNNPVVKIFDEASDNLVYALRIQGNSYTPPIYKDSRYKIRIGDPDLPKWREFTGVTPADKQPIRCRF